jgi:hypothetical protein
MSIYLVVKNIKIFLKFIKFPSTKTFGLRYL